MDWNSNYKEHKIFNSQFKSIIDMSKGSRNAKQMEKTRIRLDDQLDYFLSPIIPKQMKPDFDKYEEIAELLLLSKNLVYITGPEISASAIQIPDVPPLRLFTKKMILAQNYYKTLRTIHGKQFRESYLFGYILPILQTVPNELHLSIAKLLDIHNILAQKSSIITQNLDILHEKVKSTVDLFHLYGDLSRARCTKCKQTYDYEKILHKYQKVPDEHQLFLCESQSKSNCEGIIVPDITEYGCPILQHRSSIVEKITKAGIITLIGLNSRDEHILSLLKENLGDIPIIEISNTEFLFQTNSTIHVSGNIENILNDILSSIKTKINKNTEYSRRVRRRIKKIV